jgi:dihydroxyacetone kinase
VGELVTSLDMAGCSLTLMWLDGELERLWRAPADTPAYRKGAAAKGQEGPRRSAADAAAAASARSEAAQPVDEEARACAGRAISALDAITAAIADAEEELGRIDAVAGDGDHGRGMVRGTSAALAAARAARDAGAGPASVLTAPGDAWAARAGGTSGALWGAALAAFGQRLGDGHAPTDDQVAAGVRDAHDAIVRLGGAKPGDKTMLDAPLPFAQALSDAVGQGQPLPQAWATAAEESERAAQATADLRPQVGRARPLAERSVGTPDAGAVSLALAMRTVAGVLTRD